MDTNIASYHVDSNWTIVRANAEFCRLFRCSEAGLIGRDARDLLRADWRLDFRTYVARALVGVGDSSSTVPMVAPCGEHGWFAHTLLPQFEQGRLTGFEASVAPHVVHQAVPAKQRWDWRAVAARAMSPRLVWNFDAETTAA